MVGYLLMPHLICGIFAHAAILVHLHEVQGPVQPTGELRHIHVEGELAVLEVKHVVVLLVRGQQEGSRADVGGVLS